MKALVFGLFISGLALANSNDPLHRPEAFKTAMGKAVFVDFTEATYHINYNLSHKSAEVIADIRFHAPEAGLPIFDSVTTPEAILLNGKSVDATLTKTPSGETTVRVLNTPVAQGSHKLNIRLPLNTLVQFTGEGVKSAFWTSDLSERNFLERYLPANLEYDQVKMNFIVKFIGHKTKQKIYTNGQVEALLDNTFKITYPSHYNASSIFFHTVPENSVDEISFNLRSVDGRNVPVVIYVAKTLFGRNERVLERFKSETTKIFHELEGDYGAWPHPQLIIYNAGAGGMEYHGATMTSFTALGHELFHSYFARGVMPANGNAGWLDEALASWRDAGYQRSSSMFGTSRMSVQPYYTRTTDRAAYSFGERFMRFLDGKLAEQGGLKPFMRYLLEKKLFAPLLVEEFIAEMEKFYGVSVKEDFHKHTYGTNNSKVVVELLKGEEEHPIHRKMGLEEMKNYL